MPKVGDVEAQVRPLANGQYQCRVIEWVLQDPQAVSSPPFLRERIIWSKTERTYTAARERANWERVKFAGSKPVGDWQSVSSTGGGGDAVLPPLHRTTAPPPVDPEAA